MPPSQITDSTKYFFVHSEYPILPTAKWGGGERGRKSFSSHCKVAYLGKKKEREGIKLKKGPPPPPPFLEWAPLSRPKLPISFREERGGNEKFFCADSALQKWAIFVVSKRNKNEMFSGHFWSFRRKRSLRDVANNFFPFEGKEKLAHLIFQTSFFWEFPCGKHMRQTTKMTLLLRNKMQQITRW